MKNYGEKITGYRKKVGLLQAELAEKTRRYETSRLALGA